MMLAIYLTQPEIENDRRGLNTRAGILQAKKEGLYMGKAPRGYVNKVYEDGRRYITLDEPDASMMRWIFNCFQKKSAILRGDVELRNSTGLLS